MLKFTPTFAQTIYQEGIDSIEDGVLLDDYRWVLLIQISVIFGKIEGRSILLSKEHGDLMRRSYNEDIDNKSNFSLFAKYRIGNGVDIDIKESNKYMKKAINEGDKIALIYKATIESVRGNDGLVINYLSIGGEDALINAKMDEFKGVVQDYDDLYKTIVKDLYKL
jgi:hypothetical protein